MGNNCCEKGTAAEEKGHVSSTAPTPRQSTLMPPQSNMQCEDEFEENSAVGCISEFSVRKKMSQGKPQPRPPLPRPMYRQFTAQALLTLCNPQIPNNSKDSLATPSVSASQSVSVSPGDGQPSQKPKPYLKSRGMSSAVEAIRSLGRGVTFGIGAAQFRRANRKIIEDKYEVMSTLGKGSYGEVKLIKDREFGHLRALKVMPKSTCYMTETFAEEVKILQQLVCCFVLLIDAGPPQRPPTL
jgi:hypothetical protein